jgi:hypothetical protein
MTIEEVEDVVRALTAVAEKLEASAAKHSIQEAFMQAHAYADEMLAFASNHRCGDDGPKHGLFRSNNAKALVRSHEDGSVISEEEPIVVQQSPLTSDLPTWAEQVLASLTVV